MIILAAHAHVPTEHWDTFFAAASAILEPSRQEPGCISYDFYRHPTQPEKVLYFEEWESMEDLQNHLDAPHTKDFFMKANAIPGFVGKIHVYESEGRQSL